MLGCASQKPLRAHPCALLSGHPWPSKFLGGASQHPICTSALSPNRFSRLSNQPELHFLKGRSPDAQRRFISLTPIGCRLTKMVPLGDITEVRKAWRGALSKRPGTARNKRTWVRPSAYEAKLHATAERQQSMIAGWTRLRVLVAVFGKAFPISPPTPTTRLGPKLTCNGPKRKKPANSEN